MHDIETRDVVYCREKRFKLYLDRKSIQKRIAEIAREIDKDFADKSPILIGVLNGAFIFLADLFRYVTIDCEVDFIKLSSYGAEMISSGHVTELKHIDATLEGRHVILVEDIVDTGLSMEYLVDRVEEMMPASVSVATLLHKASATRVELDLTYVGFVIPDKFVLGYGLDYGQLGRNLPALYILDEEHC